jgi:hypothetical protein
LSLTFSLRLSATMLLSARLATHLEKWRSAPVSPPPGNMKALSGGIFAWSMSMAFSSSMIMFFVTRWTLRPSLVGDARSVPIVNRSLCNPSSSVLISVFCDEAPTRPRTELSSSTSPYALTLSESFEMRTFPSRPVSPLSPVRVYILANLNSSLLELWNRNLGALVPT